MQTKLTLMYKTMMQSKFKSCRKALLNLYYLNNYKVITQKLIEKETKLLFNIINDTFRNISTFAKLH